jgi:hypothetical protein
MATVKLSDIENVVVRRSSWNAEQLVLEFIEFFAPNCPLDEEDFEEWVKVNSLAADEVKDAAREAMRSGWVEDADDGLRLTDAGRLKTQE